MKYVQPMAEDVKFLFADVILASVTDDDDDRPVAETTDKNLDL